VTIHVISVGVNLLDRFLAAPWSWPAFNDRHPEVAAAIEQRLHPDRFLAVHAGGGSEGGEGLSAWLASCLGTPPASARNREELAEVAKAVRPELWPPRVSAELDTFARAGGSGSSKLSSQDVAVLVATDTPQGLVAALWNAVALAGGRLDRVRYLSAPGQPVDAARGCAVVARVPGLDARHERDFVKAMRGFGALGRNLLDRVARNGEEPFRFYLSGGFKAAIPYLIGLAEGLRSVNEAGPVDAWVLHETTASDAIRLPLRRMSATVARQEVSGFDQEGRRRRKPKLLLDGYAYEQVADGEWQLTAFGEGLRVLFGLPPEGLGR
jgi:hypothetical protein